VIRIFGGAGGNVVVIPYEIVNESGEVEVEVTTGESLNEKYEDIKRGKPKSFSLAAPFSFQTLSTTANM
jgi:hypothetical protein